MDYKTIIANLTESKFLISMTPIEKVVEIGFAAGMDSTSTILDLCCGYGEMLKVWNQAFGCKCVGVDICPDRLSIILMAHPNLKVIRSCQKTWEKELLFQMMDA